MRERAHYAAMEMFSRVVSPRLHSGTVDERAFLQMHRRIEYGLLLLALIAAAFAAFVLNLYGPAGPDLLPAVAQVLPVLLIAQVVQIEFKAGETAKQIAGRQPEFVRRIRGIDSKAVFFTFVLGEGSALTGIAYGPATFWVAMALLTGLLQLWDIALGINARAEGRFSLVRMVAFLDSAEGADAGPG
jgi:hypothetical protein